MEHVGYRLINSAGETVQSWGGTFGQCPGIPDVLFLQNSEIICAPCVGVAYGEWVMVPWMMEKPSPTFDDVLAERARRLALGFDFDFGDDRGVHRIGTTPADMMGWGEVSTMASSAINLGQPETSLVIVTDTGPVRITAMEWQRVLMAAALFRQPIWEKSFVLAAMTPIPDDYASEPYWS